MFTKENLEKKKSNTNKMQILPYHAEIIIIYIMMHFLLYTYIYNSFYFTKLWLLWTYSFVLIDLGRVVSLPPTHSPLFPEPGCAMGQEASWHLQPHTQLCEQLPLSWTKSVKAADNTPGPELEAVSDDRGWARRGAWAYQQRRVLKDMVLDKAFPFTAECTRWQRTLIKEAPKEKNVFLLRD